jgi:hypothetical protein
MLKVNDLVCVTETNRNNTHPAGTVVEILLVSKNKDDPKPYYAKSVDGASCYWYRRDKELVKI